MAAFLISTPQTGIDSFFATGSLLGWCFAFVRPLVATLTGLIGGVAVQTLDNESLIPAATPPPAATSQTSRLGKIGIALQYGYGTLLKSVAPALVIGLLISACIIVFVPDSLFHNTLLGNDWIAFPAMLLIGMPMYVCSTASIPVALALMAKGISPGAALIFLIVGPALNGASLTILLQLLGKKCMAIYLFTISVAAVLSGLALNALNATLGILPDYTATATTCCANTCSLTAVLRPGCAIILFILLAWHILFKHFLRAKSTSLATCGCSCAGRIVIVKKMRCDHCRGAVLNLLKSYPNVTEVIPVDNESFRVKGQLPETLASDIQKLGFELAE